MALFIVILVIYNIKIGKNRCEMLDSPVTTCMGNSCSLAVAGDVFMTPADSLYQILVFQ